MRVHVSPLPLGTTSDELQTLLKPYGEVSAASVHVKNAGERAFGFVEIAIGRKEWLQIRSRLNGTHWRGLKISLAEASPDYRVKLLAERKEENTHPVQRRKLQEKGVLRGKYIDSVSPKKIKVAGPSGSVSLGPESKHKCQLELGVEKKPTEELVSAFEKGVWKSHAGAALEDVSSLVSISSSATESDDTSVSSIEGETTDPARPSESQTNGTSNQAATALKGIFHPSKSDNNSFTLFSPPPSPEPAARHETMPASDKVDAPLLPQSHPQPLFFPHFAIPSLSVQSQFAREFNAQGVELSAVEWEEVWSGNIAEWMKSLKSRRRDALRSSRH